MRGILKVWCCRWHILKTGVVGSILKEGLQLKCYKLLVVGGVFMGPACGGWGNFNQSALCGWHSESVSVTTADLHNYQH